MNIYQQLIQLSTIFGNYQISTPHCTFKLK